MPKFLQYGDKGDRVKEVQRAINANTFHPLKNNLAVDGQMGPRTCSAVHSLKYWMGYDRGDIDPDLKDQIVGKAFMAFIQREKPLPPEYRKRRDRRKKAAAAAAKKESLSKKALSNAIDDLGLHEATNNHIKYNTWWCGGYNDGAPYCVRADSYWYAKAGSRVISPSAGRFQGTDYLLDCAKRGVNGVHLTADPDAGDIMLIDFSGHTDPDHAGLHVSGNKTIEGNATDAQGRQGVDYHERPRGNCWFIVVEE
jgi:hypothetical protein